MLLLLLLFLLRMLILLALLVWLRQVCSQQLPLGQHGVWGEVRSFTVLTGGFPLAGKFFDELVRLLQR